MVEIRVYAMMVAGAIPMAVFWSVLTVLVIGMVALLLWKGVRTGARYVSVLALVEWIFLVICATVIFRGTNAERGIRLIPFGSYFDYGEHSYLMEKVALNILNLALFIPIGFLLGCGFRNMTWKRALAIGAMFSVFIELLQLISRRGLCEVDDVMHNVVGCMIGYGVVRLLSL